MMVARAKLVIIGMVEEVRPGRVLEGPEYGEYPTEFTNTILRVNELLRRANASENLTVETYKIEEYERDWRTTRGERVLLFLRTGAPETYFPTNTQSIFILGGESLIPVIDDPSAEQLAGMSLGQLPDEIKHADELVESGKAQPACPLDRC
jgi:hypothetical protein